MRPIQQFDPQGDAAISVWDPDELPLRDIITKHIADAFHHRDSKSKFQSEFSSYSIPNADTVPYCDIDTKQLAESDNDRNPDSNIIAIAFADKISKHDVVTQHHTGRNIDSESDDNIVIVAHSITIM